MLWLKSDLLFLRSSLDRGVSIAEAARFLGTDEDEVRNKMKELGLSECLGAANSPPTGGGESTARPTWTETALEECGLLLTQINEALLTAKPERFTGTSAIVQGALEHAAAVLKKVLREGDSNRSSLSRHGPTFGRGCGSRS
jgi:hypothetical protein